MNRRKKKQNNNKPKSMHKKMQIHEYSSNIALKKKQRENTKCLKRKIYKKKKWYKMKTIVSNYLFMQKKRKISKCNF